MFLSVDLYGSRVSSCFMYIVGGLDVPFLPSPTPLREVHADKVVGSLLKRGTSAIARLLGRSEIRACEFTACCRFRVRIHVGPSYSAAQSNR